MNLRVGMARVARVTAIVYWLAAALVVWSAVRSEWDGRQDELHPRYWTVTVADGRQFTVPGAYEYDAEEVARAYAAAHPAPKPPATAASSPWSGDDIFADPVPARGPAIALKLDRYEHPRGLDAVLRAGLAAAFWCALIYAGLWAAFRAVRWVALGFMQSPAV